MKMFEITCKVEAGRITDSARKKIVDAIANYDGKDILVKITEAQKKRSDRQNRYYWGVIIPSIRQLMNDTWGNDMTVMEVHEYLKRSVGKITKAIKLPEGGYDIITNSSTQLTTVEFEAYNERCRAYGAQNGIAIPLPNEVMGEVA